MAHPCRTGNPGTIMHACDSELSTKTLCGQDVDVATVGTVWGFKAICPGCYPAKNPVAGPGDPLTIPGREGMDDEIPD